MARSRLNVALFALLALSAGLCRIGQAAAPVLTRGDIVFADPVALYNGTMGDEFEFDGRGAIYKQDPTTGVVTVLSEGQSFVDPTNLAIEPSGTILVVDQNWGENQQSAGGAGGAVLRVDPSQPSTSNATVLSSGGIFVDPVGITLDPSTGDIYVCDRNGASAGKVIRIDPITGAQTEVVSGNGNNLVNPQDIVWGTNGLLYVVDPVVGNIDGGFVAEIYPPNGNQFVLSFAGNFVDPVGIDVDPVTGNLLVADEEAGASGFGAIVGVDVTTGAQTLITSEGNFEHPRDVAVESTSSLVATDPVVGFGSGAIIRVARATGAQTVFATGGDTTDDFIEPLGVQVVRNLAPTVQANKTVTVNEDSVNNALNIPAPVDPEGDLFTIKVNTVPTATYGYVHVPGSTTELKSGDTLTTAQLTGLQFDTIPDAYGSAGMFIYTVDDGNAASSQAITLEITALSDPPEAFDQTYMGTEDFPISVTLPATDPDGDVLVYTVVSGPAHGTVEMGTTTSPNRTYTPNLNYHGLDSFTFKANDGMSDSNVATIYLDVASVNDAPVGLGVTFATIDEDTTQDFDLTPADPDVGDTFTYTFTGPSHGSLSGTGNLRTYTPNANYHGTDTFTYTANDGMADSNTTTVNITINSVNDKPVGFPQSISLNENGSYTGFLVATDVDGDPVSYYFGSTTAIHGVVSLTVATGKFTYTPVPGYHGPDSFSFQAYDTHVFGNNALVTIDVVSVNDPPTTTGQSVTTDEDTAKPITLGASDPDGDTLTYSIVSGPSHGTVSPGTGASRTYTPAANYHGTDSFTFKVNDGTVDSNISTVSITINSVNDDPVAQPQSVSTLEDTPVDITLVGTDVDGDSLLYIYVGGSGVSHGALSFLSNNVWRYTPNANYHGPDSFSFRVSDGTSGSLSAEVTINVISVNDPPVAVGNSYNTPRGTAVEPAAPGVLGNDSDVDGDTLTAVLVTNVTGGTLTLNPNGSFRYVPRIGTTGADSFTYKAYDGQEYSNVVTVTINVSPDPPASTPDGKVEGSGTIPVTGGNGTFAISARKTAGVIMGSVTYTDPNRLRTVSSTQLTSVVVTGKKARVFGKGKRPDGVLVDFVVDVNDVAEPGRLKDTFQIELSTNTTSGPGTLTLGNIIVTGGTAPAPLAPSITKTKPKRRH